MIRRVLLGAAAAGLCWVLIAAGGSGYLTDYRLNPNPDARQYVVLGENLWARGEYSRQDAPPYVPDLLRTPVYPLIAGGLHLASGVAWPLYLFNVVCFLATIVAVQRLGALIDPAVGRLAGALYAVNPMAIILCFEAMTEPLFTALSTWLCLLWIRAMSAPPRLRSAAVAGALAGIAMLTRPAGLLLPFAMAAATVWMTRRRWARRATVVWTAVFLATCSAVATPWIARNARVHHLARLSNVDSINLLYYTAAGCQAERDNVTLERAQAELAARYGVPTVDQVSDPWLMPGVRLADVDGPLRNAALDVMARMPLSCVTATVKGLAKSLVSHNASVLAEAAGLTWTPVGLDRVLSGDVVGALHGLISNASAIQLAVLVQLSITFLILLAAPAGAIAAARLGAPRGVVMALVTVGGYHLLTIALVGLNAYYRFRSALEPMLFVLAAAGTIAMWKRAFGRRGQRSTRD